MRTSSSPQNIPDSLTLVTGELKADNDGSTMHKNMVDITPMKAERLHARDLRIDLHCKIHILPEGQHAGSVVTVISLIGRKFM